LPIMTTAQLQIQVTNEIFKIGEIEKDMAAAQGTYNECLDTIWMLLAAMLVFFMHAGFSLLEAGSVRFKNAQNILAKNLLTVCVGFLCWYSFGWAFAYGTSDDPGRFVGYKQVFMDGTGDTRSSYRNWFFQGAFCATAATIVSGAVAERTQLKGFAIFVCVMTAWIYPVVVYWGWSGSGLLVYKEKGTGKSVSFVGPAYADFAGSGIVHMVGGVGALCGALMVGPRKGRFDTNPTEDFAPHHVPFCVLGTFCLWFGWYGFNPGSTLSMHTADTAYQAGLVAVNTTLAPCVGGLMVFALRALVCPPKQLEVVGFCNGILAGLVSITAGCAIMKPWESVIIGAIGGCVYQGASMLMLMVKIDDVVDAFAVHGATGFWGVLAVGLFGDEEQKNGGNGLFYGGDQFRTQFVGALLIALWTVVMSMIVLVPLKIIGFLRLSDDFQDQGADVVEHSPPKAYSGEAQKPDQGPA